jgi:uncharacterized SAM-binding protein YcdF (DUF218 family)
LTVDDSAALYEAMALFDGFEAGFTLFAVDSDRRVVGSLSRGDVIRCLSRRKPADQVELTKFRVRDAMNALSDETGGMLWVSDDRRTWWSQLTAQRERAGGRLHRIRLIPVLNAEKQLVSVLDLEEPRTRSRLETLVMAAAFPLGTLTAKALANRRGAFASVHYDSHWEKVAGLCDLLLQDDGARYPFIEDIFAAARADEVVHGLFRAEEWLEWSLASPSSPRLDRDSLKQKIAMARKEIVQAYTRSSAGQSYYPVADKNVTDSPEVIVVLGCKRDARLFDRIDEAVKVIKEARTNGPTTVIFSGGGSDDQHSGAGRMLARFRQLGVAMSNAEDELGFWNAEISNHKLRILLEEDSLDTLGNAVFSWCTLKLHGQRGLEAKDNPRLDRLVVVTDRLHAPRSFDLFRRVFAFRPPHKGVPTMVVRLAKTVSNQKDEETVGMEHLRTEAVANSQSFRLINPLTNGLDVMEDGHVRSLFAQMLRLHPYYENRGDLARKYRRCWSGGS